VIIRPRLRVLAVCAVLAAGATAADPGAAVDLTRGAGTGAEQRDGATVSRLPQLPTGGRRIFAHHILVAYYGTAHNAALGVLGEVPPAEMTRRLRAAARPFGSSTRKVQIVYELIVAVADASPGSDGDYSHLIPRSYVEQYVRAARRHKALLVLDLQPGRSGFLPTAQAFAWALRKPFVGLALDPEWRMGPHEVPAQTIGSVKAAEVNRVSRFVARLTRRHRLPQKLFMVHQFRTDMVQHIERVRRHKVLAMVQHVDGFGSQQQKLSTYHNVARPQRFHLGFKLFYDEDSDLFTPREVRGLRPRVDYVSYQ